MRKPESDYRFEIATSGVESNPPNPERTKDAFSRIGYSLEEAIADLIDNSIDAGASDVLVRLVYDDKSIHRIFIVDNGKGMKESVLSQAMKFGSTLAHQKTDLGKYGIGLKAASLSQCRQFSVITRSGKEVSGRRWSAESFHENWLCEKLDVSGCAVILSAGWNGLDIRKSGTIVMWEDLTGLQAGDGAVSETVNKAISGLENHLGLVFHKFIESEDLAIHLDSQFADQRESGVTQIVEPLNPFKYSKSGTKGYPKEFEASVDSVGKLKLLAHIWPKKSREAGYNLSHDRGIKVAT